MFKRSLVPEEGRHQFHLARVDQLLPPQDLGGGKTTLYSTVHTVGRRFGADEKGMCLR
jgi:hypothetical protein